MFNSTISHNAVEHLPQAMLLSEMGV